MSMSLYRSGILLLYVGMFLLYIQYAFLNNYLIKDIYWYVDSFVTTNICNSVRSKENIAMETGRYNHLYPSPRCCHGIECLQNTRKKRNIVLTTLRNDKYLPLLRNLVCTFRNSNPNITLAVGTVKGDLSQAATHELTTLKVEIIIWEDLTFINTKSERFALNWVKIRAWELDQFASILMIDADTVVVGDISHLFQLPTAFATALDQDKDNARFSSLGRMQGGVILLRPCPSIASHMISLLMLHEHLRFTRGHAEQSFFDWYFRYDRWSLPIAYNAIGHLLEDNMVTYAGTAPIIVHYTKYKPFRTEVEKYKEHYFAICNSSSN